MALSCAEESLEFEHRDLHVSNIMIATTLESTIQSNIR